MTTLPHLISLNMPSRIDLSHGPQTFTITASAAEDGGSIKYVSVILSPTPVAFAGTEPVGTFDFGTSGSDTFSDSTPTTAAGTFTVDAANAPGTYTVAVLVADNAAQAVVYTGNQLVALGIPKVVVFENSLAPAAPTVTHSPQGMSGDPHPVFSGTGTPGATLEIVAQNVRNVRPGDAPGQDHLVLKTLTVPASGTWSWTAPGLANDSYQAVTVRQLVGGMSSANVSLPDFQVATVPKPLTTAHDANGVVHTASPLLQGTAGAGDTVSIMEGSQVLGTATANAGGTWNLRLSGLAEGSHSLVAHDATAQGDSATAPLVFTVDSHAPHVHIDASAALVDQVGSGLDKQVLVGVLDDVAARLSDVLADDWTIELTGLTVAPLVNILAMAGAASDTTVPGAGGHIKASLYLSAEVAAMLVDPALRYSERTVAILAHEMLHTLGVSVPFSSRFDSLVDYIDGKGYFIGPAAQAVYGGPVPLSDATDHLGVWDDLMYGKGVRPGTYALGSENPTQPFSPVDLAILEDLGYRMRNPVSSNVRPTGTVSIHGDGPYQNGSTFTAENTLQDADGTGTVSYQWLRDGKPIAGATGSTYKLMGADVGYQVSVRASYVDGHGTPERVQSAPTWTVVSVNVHPTGGLALHGIPQLGQTLTFTSTLADADGMGPLSYQWLRDQTPIAGATGASYVLATGDVGHVVSVSATYTDGHGTNEYAESAGWGVTKPNTPPTGGITVTGDAIVGHQLTVASTLADADGMGPLSYVWWRNGTRIDGVTGPTYTLTDADVATWINVDVTYTDANGTVEFAHGVTATQVVAAPTVVNSAPAGQVSVGITNGIEPGAVLLATNDLVDADGMGTVSYQWLRGGVTIDGATGDHYTLTQADVGHEVKVQASYIDGRGTHESVTSKYGVIADNKPTGSVSISGTAVQNGVLTASNNLADIDGMGTVTYSWLREGQHIPGATGSTYTLTEQDVGLHIYAVGAYTDGKGYAEGVVSQGTEPVANVNDLPTGSVTVSGTAAQGSTLSASNTLSDPDGMYGVVFAYQWLRGGQPINGATGTSYTIGSADAGAAVSVSVSYVDGHGTHESVTSNALSVPAPTPAPTSAPTPAPTPAPNTPPTGSISLHGEAKQGETLTVTSTLQDAQGMGPLSWQWQRDGSDIGGATGTTYALSQADVGKHISVIAQYKDGAGHAESAHSGASDAVANVNDAPTGYLMVAGGATEGGSLSAISTIADADGLGTLQYQWLRDGKAIGGATGAQYTLQHVDVGASVSVQASYTDGFGAHESVSSGAVAVAGVDKPGTVPGQVVAGTDGSDNLHGGAAADVFMGSAGNDSFDGGAGVDTVVYNAPVTQFDITMTASGFTITDKAGNGGTDQLTNVERVVFGDTAVALDIDGAAGMGFRLYQAVFDRAPDAGGMGYWLNQLDGGMSLHTVAQAFMDSGEFKTMYGSQPDSTQFLTALYKYALHRDPDAGGIAFWNDAIKSGAVSMVDVLIQFSESGENQAQVIGSEQHGIHYTPWH